MKSLRIHVLIELWEQNSESLRDALLKYAATDEGRYIDDVIDEAVVAYQQRAREEREMPEAG